MSRWGRWGEEKRGICKKIKSTLSPKINLEMFPRLMNHAEILCCRTKRRRSLSVSVALHDLSKPIPAPKQTK